MSIAMQATFWRRNVQDYVDSEGEYAMFSEGFAAFSGLLRRMYDEHAVFEVSTAEPVPTKIGIAANDLEDYHNLTDALDFLYHAAASGTAVEEGAASCLRVPKADFKRAFKGSATLPMAMLERFDFYFRYEKGGRETAAYKACDTFALYHDGGASLPAALKCFVDRLPAATAKEDYLPTKNLFYVADYGSALWRESTKQQDIDPLREGILRTAGSQAALWQAVAGAMGERFGLTARASINPYVFPHWDVRFLRGKKTVCTFEVHPDRLKLRLPLSCPAAKAAILRRHALPASIRTAIERFGCCGCGKCKDRQNIEVVDGIGLCTLRTTSFLTEDARLIGIALETQAEADAVLSLVGELLA